MHLSIYGHNFAPEPIGIPVYTTGMAVWLRQRLGWRVTMHTGVPHYPWWRVPPEYAQRDYRAGRGDEVYEGVVVERVRHFVPSEPVGGMARMRLDASYLWRVWRRSFGMRRRPDAIITVAPPFLVGLLGLFLAWRLRVPVAYHVQDLQIDAAADLGMLPRGLCRALFAIERMIIRRVDLVSTVSEGMRRRLLAKTDGAKPVVLFPNWADTDRIRPWAGANSYRAAWGVADDEIVLMYSGNLGRKQGLEVLLDAVARMRRPCRIVIAGDGAERAELERRARELGLANLTFTTLVPPERLAEFLSAGDIHCLPQRRAAAGSVMPSKLLNIMAVARPVVVTADPGTDLAREIQRAACGLVAQPEEPAALAAALDALAVDAARRRELGAAGRLHVERTYAIDAVMGSFARRLRALAARRRGRRGVAA